MIVRTCLILVVALVVVVVAGCGGSTESTSPEGATSLPSATIQPISTAASPTATVPAAPAPAPDPAVPSTTTATTTSTSPADEAAIRTVVTAYVDAFVAGDGEAACALLAPSVQQEFLDAIGSSESCATAFSAVVDLQDASVLDRFRNASVGDIQVTGDIAVASLTAAGATVPVSLLRGPDGWTIANLPTG